MLRRLLAGLLAIGASGCAHYNLPVSRLETPEVPGEGRTGRISASMRLSTDLLAESSLTQPDPESGEAAEARLSGAGITPSLEAERGFGPRWEAGLRLQPQAPLQIRGKYQFSGHSETDAGPGDLAAAAVAAVGFLLGQEGSRSTTYTLLELALPVGYRLSKRHLALFTPFFSSASLSGVTLPPVPSASGTTPAAVTGGGGSATQYGAGLGWQMTVEALFVRGELDWYRGALGETSFGGLALGAALGLNL
jgi:hypothetical protein